MGREGWVFIPMFELIDSAHQLDVMTSRSLKNEEEW